jgi:hypothetical protein
MHIYSDNLQLYLPYDFLHYIKYTICHIKCLLANSTPS